MNMLNIDNSTRIRNKQEWLSYVEKVKFRHKAPQTFVPEPNRYPCHVRTNTKALTDPFAWEFYYYKFVIGERVRKNKGSEWEGVIVGTYSTALTPEGYCVESCHHKGSVQIYPAAALELLEDK